MEQYLLTIQPNLSKKIKESHKESVRNVTFEYKELAPIFEGVEEKQIKALSNQLEHIKSLRQITTQGSINMLANFTIFPVHSQLTGRIY